MGMSTHVYGIKPPDDTWRRMKAVYEACEDAGILPPPEVDQFFDHEKPDDKGVIVGLDCPAHEAVTEYSDNSREGYEIDLSKLPKDIKIVRFLNSW